MITRQYALHLLKIKVTRHELGGHVFSPDVAMAWLLLAREGAAMIDERGVYRLVEPIYLDMSSNDSDTAIEDQYGRG